MPWPRHHRRRRRCLSTIRAHLIASARNCRTPRSFPVWRTAVVCATMEMQRQCKGRKIVHVEESCIADRRIIRDLSRRIYRYISPTADGREWCVHIKYVRPLITKCVISVYGKCFVEMYQKKNLPISSTDGLRRPGQSDILIARAFSQASHFERFTTHWCNSYKFRDEGQKLRVWNFHCRDIIHRRLFEAWIALFGTFLLASFFSDKTLVALKSWNGCKFFCEKTKLSAHKSIFSPNFRCA